nr:MAG TPA: hypothetical protein [Caudoviricetes sp.]
MCMIASCRLKVNFFFGFFQKLLILNHFCVIFQL